MEKPKGKFKCLVCNTVCDGSELVFDPQRGMWTCSDYFCGANVMKIAENDHEYRIRQIEKIVNFSFCW